MTRPVPDGDSAMTPITLPRPADADTFYAWTERQLGERLDAGDAERSALTAKDWPAERARRRELLASVLIPDWEVPDPMVTETGTIDREADGHRWTIHKLRFQSLPDYWVTALLYVPEGAGPGTPAVLLAQGHSPEAKAYPEYHSLSEELVRQGIIVLAYDPPGQGERVMNWNWLRGGFDIGWGTTEHDVMGMKALLCGWPVAQAWVWDGMRALDVLLARPEVDAERVGMCGVSGGGTQTTWLIGADDRITHASPACFITGWREQFHVRLGADPEQHPYPVQAWGWDQTDVLASFAPKPLQVTAVTNDFFPIEGTRTAVRKLEELYGNIGARGGVTLSETPDVDHGYFPPVREATVRWFCEQFGIEFNGGVPARNILPPEELNVTPTGQLITSGFPRTLHDIIGDTRPVPRGARMSGDAMLRKNKWQQHRRELLRKLLGLSGDMPGVGAEQVDTTESEDGTVERWHLTPEPGLNLGAMLVRPKSSPRGIALHLHEHGADTDWELPGGPVYGLLDAGWIVVSVDPRGVGASRDRLDTDEKWFARFGSEQTAAWTWLMMDRPLMGQRVFDVLQTLRWVADLPGCGGLPVAAVGIGAGAHWAMLAGALDSRIDEVVAVAGIVDFRSIVDGHNTRWPMTALVPHIHTWGDMPQVACIIAPRKLTIIAPTDEMRNAASAVRVRSAYGPARKFYEEAFHSPNFHVVAAGERPESLRVDYREYLTS